MQHPAEKLYVDFFQNRKPGCDSFTLRKKKNGIITHRRVMVHEEHIVVKTIQEVKIKEEKKTVSCHEKVRGGFAGPTARERSYILAKKMKELEMLDAYNMDHVLDVHEVLYHYSHLTCPVYLDIVDKFFVNMYPDFFLPRPTVHVKKSMRKVHTIKL